MSQKEVKSIRGFYKGGKAFSPIVISIVSNKNINGEEIPFYSALSRMSSLSEAKAMQFLAANMESNANSIYLTPPLRRRLVEFLEVSDNTISIILRKLKEGGLLYKDNDNVFHINPYFYWNGNFKSRYRFIVANKEWVEEAFGTRFSQYSNMVEREKPIKE